MSNSFAHVEAKFTETSDCLGKVQFECKVRMATAQECTYSLEPPRDLCQP
jgi:hypothetical protein